MNKFIEFDGICINTNEILYFNISEIYFILFIFILNRTIRTK